MNTLIQNGIYSQNKAVHHYLSHQRCDAVKAQWEEPFSCKVLRIALDKIGYLEAGENFECKMTKKKLRVLDLGCGIGDGLSLLKKIVCVDHIDYVGLDISTDMIETARIVHSATSAKFVKADFREYVPMEPFDLYLSCGIPYSHITPSELRDTLKMIFANIHRNQTRSVVIVDVLGQYSIEWVSKWSISEWQYRMSFFSSKEDVEASKMSFYSSDTINKVIKQAASDVGGVDILRMIEYFDRSIMVGRHTSTLEFNPNIPKYRDLVNNLFDRDKETDLRQLLFQAELGDAPKAVETFFQGYSKYWDDLILNAAFLSGAPIFKKKFIPSFALLKSLIFQSAKARPYKNFRASVIEPALATSLKNLEFAVQPGLGVGHSLIATVYVGK